LYRGIIPLGSLIPPRENESDEKSSKEKETLHANSSIHSRSISRSILSAENSTKISPFTSLDEPSNDSTEGPSSDIHGSCNTSLGGTDDVILLKCDESWSIALSTHDGKESSEESNLWSWTRNNESETGDTQTSLEDDKPATSMESISEI
jgi:hypothetical protein